MAADIQRAIARLAARQHGNITHRQLIELGLGPDAITYRARTGRLHRVHLGVYAVGRPAQTFHERAAAAVLACGPGAVLSHLAAAQLWGFTKPKWVDSFDVITPNDRRPRGIRVHVTTLSRQDRRREKGIWVTSPARTALDCSLLLPDKALTRLVNDARLSRHLTLNQLADVVARYSRHQGVRLLRPHAETTDGATRSPFEDDFPGFCAHFGLPRPQMNCWVPVLGREVDAWFERERVAVELDGYATHSSRKSFEDDRDHDFDALVHGILTPRITRSRIAENPAREAARLHDLLESRL